MTDPQLREIAKPQNILESIAERLNVWLGAHWRLYVILCAGLSLLTWTGYSHAKVPWVDEVLQMTIERLPSAQQVWATMRPGHIQMDPPVLHLAVHYLFRLFGEHVLLARLPSILGFCLMCVCLACLVRRHAPPLYAAATFFLPYATALRGRAMDARPYGLMMCFSALTLLCWDSLEESRHPLRIRIIFTLSLAATLSTHFYSILILLPLAVGELVKWVTRKRPDWTVLTCVSTALIPYFFWLPTLLSASRRYMKTHHYKVVFQSLYEFFGFAVNSFTVAAILLLLIAAVAFFGVPRMTRTPLSERQRRLLAASAGFLAIPMAVYVAGVLVTKLFIPYHLILTVFGMVVGLPLLLATMTGRSGVVGLCLFLAATGHGLFVTARGLSGFLRREAPYPQLAEVRRLIPEPRPDIVVPSPLHFLPFQEANRPDPQDNLLYLFDARKAMQTIGTDTSELLYEELRRVSTARIEPFDLYTSTHRQFYLAVLGEVKGVQEWQFTYLFKQAHARLWWLGKAGDFDLFRVNLDERPPGVSLP